MVPAFLDKIALGLRILALTRHNTWSRVRLLDYQSSALKRLRAFALDRSPFYKRFHRGLEAAPLNALPILTKGRLMAEFDDVVTDRDIRLAEIQSFAANMSLTDLYRDKYQVVATSGTTGERGHFLFNRQEWVTTMAGLGRASTWGGLRLADHERGMFMTTTLPWHMTARGSAFLRRIGLGAGRASLNAGDTVPDLVAKLNAYQPTSLTAYPSAMQLLAAEQRAGRLHISPLHIQCTSEVLTEEARTAITDTFGVSPANLYAASECGCIAGTCAKAQGFHTPEDLVILEPVDEHGRAVPAGYTGHRVLLTVLHNRTMPLIRYELSDQVGIDPTPCHCGMPFARLKTLQGRSGDILALKTKNGGEIQFSWAQINTTLRGLPLTGWQIALSPTELRISCVPSRESLPEAEVRQRLACFFDSQGSIYPSIVVQAVGQLHRGPTGKAKLITVSKS